MDIAQIRTMSLKLMDEYSLSGALEGGQLTADYLFKVNTFIDMAQNEITDHVGIYATQTIDTSVATPAKTSNGYNYYDLAADIKDFRYIVKDDEPLPFASDNYEVINGQFKISNGYSNTVFEIHYYKYPDPITDLSPDNTQLEVDLYTQYAIPYFVAGMCGASASEDMQLSDKLMAVWATKLNAMTKREIRAPRRARVVVTW